MSLPPTKCPTEAKKKLKYENQLIIDFAGQNKTNTTEFLFLYYNGYHLRKQWQWYFSFHAISTFCHIFYFMQYQHFVIFFILSKTHLHRWICCVKFFAKSSPKPGQWTSIVFLCIVAILWFPPAKNINWTSV